MEKSKVVLVRCDSYDPGEVLDALRRGIALLGGIERFARPGEKICLKPNILAGDDPSQAVTTHPAVLAGCIDLLREAGAQVSFGDSPGMENAVHAARGAGLAETGRVHGAELGNFSAGSLRENPAGQLEKRIPIAQAVQECDGLINLPKLKTHQLTRVTGAIKNLFGCVPGQRKALYHVQYQNIGDFCNFLIDLSLCLKPRLHILDGIIAMEGNGPRSGDPRAMNLLALSTDPVALDATLCRLIDLDPAYVPTILAGARRGLGFYREDQIELLGEPLALLRQPDFKVIRRPVLRNATYAFYNFIKNPVLPRPVIDAARCLKCGLCIKACPVPDKALQFESHAGKPAHPPVYDYDRCIRCYCCHEMCPSRAIEKKTPWLGKLLQLG
jgi:uncharacterized protein (DUF362 family)/ferredoxin